MKCQYLRTDIGYWVDREIFENCKLMRAATLALANHKDEYEVAR